MMVFIIHSGPYNQPNGSRVKWLDMPDIGALKSGWYAGETKYAWCPLCHSAIQPNFSQNREVNKARLAEQH